MESPKAPPGTPKGTQATPRERPNDPQAPQGHPGEPPGTSKGTRATPQAAQGDPRGDPSGRGHRHSSLLALVFGRPGRTIGGDPAIGTRDQILDIYQS